MALLASINFVCKEKDKTKDEPPRGLTDLTFHSSRCFGTCPEISLHIDGEGNAQLLRFIFTGKGDSDSTRSGGFKGILSKQDFDTLHSLVNPCCS